ncbi:MAG: sel1 repeat family protein [Proteobacteria bacterium]|nr:sel1 repeat family protein [Pseudomonadota bacterium]
MNKISFLLVFIIYAAITQAYENYQIDYNKNFFEQYIFAYTNGELICPKPNNPKVDGKLRTEFAAYLEGAKKGSLKYAYYVSLGYLNGFGTEVNNVKGMYWLRKAVQGGYGPARVTFAALVMYKKKIFGDLITNPPTEKEMMNWLEEAAASGDSIAKLGLEVIYLDKNEEPYVFSLAEPMAKKGYAQDQYILGNMYYYGLGVKIDYLKASYWYKQALKNDPPLIVSGMMAGNLMDIYTKPGYVNPKLALYWQKQLDQIIKIHRCEI